MGNGSIESSFKFDSYKVDSFNFQMAQYIDLLNLNESLDPSLWNYNINIRQPHYFQENQQYIAGLEVALKCNIQLSKEETEDVEEDKDKSLDIVQISAGIAGTFSVNEQMSKEVEAKLTKIQAPALLFPYLRGTITSFLANAGFGTFVFPLINIHELAKNQTEDIEIKVV